MDPLPAASDSLGRERVVRVVDHSTFARTATIFAYADWDTRHETRRLSLGAGETVHFNSDDPELGNRPRGLTGGTEPGTGAWRLAISGVGEAHAYVRISEGFLTAMHDVAPRARSVPGGVLQPRQQHEPGERAAAAVGQRGPGRAPRHTAAAQSGRGREGADAHVVRMLVRNLRRKLGDSAGAPR